MVDWGVLQDTTITGIYKPYAKRKPASTKVQLWFLEAVLRSQDGQALLVQQIASLPVAFPFHLDITAADIRKSERFEIQRQGLDIDMVTASSR